jgi:eukaryotic-like serine/threonine-protein kinase
VKDLGGMTVGHYRLEQKIASGGMGDVYLARHTLIAKRVAVKVLKPELATDNELLGRFFQEARSVNEINHPNIVDIIDYGHAADDLFYFTMEYLEGETVAQRIESRGISVEEARRILMQCASALAGAHNAGIVHRDLKPENIFLLRRGNQVKLLDFGIAKLTKAGRVVHTQNGEIFGTPEYMSPEQASGRTDLDGRSDIYSLGVVMYELWTGNNPFERETMGQTLTAQMFDTPPPLREKNPHLPPMLESICLRCLEKRPESRFPNMEAVEFALEQPHRYMQRRNQELGKTGEREVEKYRSGKARTITVQRDAAGKSLITLRRMPLKPVVLAGVGVVLMGVSLAFGLAHRKPAPPLPPPVAVVVPAPSPRPVQALIVSTPAGATVQDGEARLGVTPLTVSRPAGTTLRLALTLNDYQPARRELTLSADQELDFILTPVPKPAEIVPTPPPPRRAKAPPQRPPATTEPPPVEPEGLIPTEL